MLYVGHRSVALGNRADRGATASNIGFVVAATRYSGYQSYKVLVDSLLKFICLISLFYLQLCMPILNAGLSVKEQQQASEPIQVMSCNSCKSVETPTSCDHVEL